MKNGERTPKAVKTQIVKMVRSIPRPTNQVIRVQVEHRFDIEISDRTIYRICEKEGLSTRSKPADITHSWVAQMEQSGHWPNLRGMAQDFSAQLSVHLPQLLGFPWLHSRNESLHLFPGEKGIVAGHTMKEDALFLALWEHLPRHKALAFLNDWKSTAGNVASALNDLCTWIEEQPEVSGREWLGEEEIDGGEVGLTRYFSKSLVLVLAEEMFHPRQGSSDWEVLEPYSQRETYLLNWVRNGSSFVHVAASQERGELEDLTALHQVLLVRMQSSDIFQAICKEGLKREGIAVKLKKELDHIANLAQITGRCSLCAVG